MAITCYFERRDLADAGISKPFHLDEKATGFDSHSWKVEDLADYMQLTADLETSDYFAERGGIVGAHHVGTVDRELTASYIGTDISAAQRAAQTFFQPGQKVTVTLGIRGEARKADGVIRVSKVVATDALVTLTMSVTYEDPYFYSSFSKSYSADWKRGEVAGYAYIHVKDYTALPPLAQQNISDIAGDSYRIHLHAVPPSGYVKDPDMMWTCNLQQSCATAQIGGEFDTEDYKLRTLFDAHYIYTDGVIYDTITRPYSLTFLDEESVSQKGISRGFLESAAYDIGRTNNSYGSLFSATYSYGEGTGISTVDSFTFVLDYTRRRYYRGIL